MRGKCLLEKTGHTPNRSDPKLVDQRFCHRHKCSPFYDPFVQKKEQLTETFRRNGAAKESTEKHFHGDKNDIS